jgi:hypothetical protein
VISQHQYQLICDELQDAEERIEKIEKAYNLLRDTVNEQVPSLPNGKPKFIIRDICEVTI